jgi:hypothetical protein
VDDEVPAGLVETCALCREYVNDAPHLASAAASVGISRGITTAEAVQLWLEGYHRRGHQPFGSASQVRRAMEAP